MHPYAIRYAIALRAVLLVLAVRHVCKRSYKPAGSAAAAFALTFLPGVLERFLSYQLDPVGDILYNTILIMTVYMGNSLKYYDRFAWWDYLVHFLSGGLFVCMGVSLVKQTVALSRLPALIFSFTLSLALHLIWETLEYLADSVFHTDNQRWQRRNPDHNHQPRGAVQPAGLVDTMNDGLICILGTLIACSIWWFAL